MSTDMPPLLGITAHDPEADRRLRRQLAVLRDRSPGTPFARLIDEVLAGRRTLRDAAQSDEWARAITPTTTALTQAWAALSPEQQQGLLSAPRSPRPPTPLL
jgi:hypothetical protein